MRPVRPVRVKTGKAVSRYLGAFVFLLLLIKDFFPSAALAFTSANSCFKDAACKILLQEAFSSSVKAPLDTGAGNAQRISVTDSSGATKAAVDSVGNTAMVVAPSPAYATFHYWDQATNGRAQDRARELYCAAHPNDLVCTPFTGGQSDGVLYQFTLYYKYSPHQPAANYLIKNVTGPIEGVRSIKAPLPAGSGVGYVDVKVKHIPGRPDRGGGWWNLIRNSITTEFFAEIRNVQRMDNQPDTGGNPPPLPWKDWPQAKRDTAVGLLTDTDWQSLANSMPAGGVLDGADRLNAEKIVIPGQETDDPNTPADERLLRKEDGFFTWPGIADFDKDGFSDETDPDDDNDGTSDTPDPAPRNPSVPVAVNTEDAGEKFTPEVVQEIRDIVNSYKPDENLKCVECAGEIEAYLKEQGIHGRRIKLDTTRQVNADYYIYDDSLPQGAPDGIIADNGHHEGIAIRINGEEIVFDNHHPDGVLHEQWMNNLTFYGKEHRGDSFRESGYLF